MCEPTHSITQIPPTDEGGRPTEVILGLDTKKESFLKRILRWLHFSRMGRGHTESIVDTPLKNAKLEEIGYALYECRWWDRKVTRDGFRGRGVGKLFSAEGRTFKDMVNAETLEAATEYANRVSIGNMTMLRQFLTMSLKNTDRVAVYVEAFYNMLNAKGRDELRAKAKIVTGTPLSKYDVSMYTPSFWTKEKLTGVINLLCGFTRKRELLIPEWADDGLIWKEAKPQAT